MSTSYSVMTEYHMLFQDPNGYTVSYRRPPAVIEYPWNRYSQHPICVSESAHVSREGFALEAAHKPCSLSGLSLPTNTASYVQSLSKLCLAWSWSSSTRAVDVDKFLNSIHLLTVMSCSSPVSQFIRVSVYANTMRSWKSRDE